MKTKFFTLVLVVILTATTLGFVPSASLYLPPQDERVGGIDFDQYCRSVGATHHGIDTGKGRDGVYCQFGSGGSIQWLGKGQIDQACRNQYGGSAYAAHDGTNHPYAWYCARPSAPSSGSSSSTQQDNSSSSNSSANQNGSQNQSSGSTNNSGSNVTIAACSGYKKSFLSGQSTLPSSGKYLTTGYDKLLLRSGAGQDKCSYGWLKKGDYYPVLSQSGDWYKTQAGGITGWVMKSYVSTIQGSTSSSSQSQTSPSPAPAPKANSCFYGKGIDKIYMDGEWHHYVWFRVDTTNISSWKVSSPSWMPSKYQAQLWGPAESGIAKAGFGWVDWFPTTILASSFTLCPQ